MSSAMSSPEQNPTSTSADEASLKPLRALFPPLTVDEWFAAIASNTAEKAARDYGVPVSQIRIRWPNEVWLLPPSR